MNATIQNATDAELRKLVKISFTASDAQAEINRRNALVSAQADKARANGVTIKGLGKLTYRDALVAYVHIKSPMDYYGSPELPESLRVMKESLFAYLKECDAKLSAQAIQEYLTK